MANPTNQQENASELAAFCPVCERRFAMSRTKQIARDGETELYYGTCGRCCNHVLSLVMTDQQGMSSIGLITDLSEQDVTRLRTGAPLTANDVVAAHAWISGFRLDRATLETVPFQVRSGIRSTKRQPSVRVARRQKQMRPKSRQAKKR
ncbi:hypothetical protein HYV73_02400 [Candidatus Uhrbacteria bacterium]|nr:hypothetical protein [Candidatus Uhrbacteria bacterium]